MKSSTILSLILTFFFSCGGAPHTESLREALEAKFDVTSVEIFTVTPPQQLEIVMRSDEFADADQDELMAMTREVALFVADRLSADAGIDEIAVELVIQRTDVGPFFKSTSIRGTHPLSSM